MTNREEWRPVVGFDGEHEVSDRGRVRNAFIWAGERRRQVLKQYGARSGHLSVTLQNSNGRKRCWVHRLVAQAFLSNPDNKPEVNHKDGNPANNHADNLEWMTHRENLQHAVTVLGRKGGARGERNPQARLTATQARAIRERYAEGKTTQKELAAAYGVSLATVGAIIRRKFWKDV